jgi:hypothetical protein
LLALLLGFSLPSDELSTVFVDNSPESFLTGLLLLSEVTARALAANFGFVDVGLGLELILR